MMTRWLGRKPRHYVERPVPGGQTVSNLRSAPRLGGALLVPVLAGTLAACQPVDAAGRRGTDGRGDPATRPATGGPAAAGDGRRRGTGGRRLGRHLVGAARTATGRLCPEHTHRAGRRPVAQPALSRSLSAPGHAANEPGARGVCDSHPAQRQLPGHRAVPGAPDCGQYRWLPRRLRAPGPGAAVHQPGQHALPRQGVPGGGRPGRHRHPGGSGSAFAARLHGRDQQHRDRADPAGADRVRQGGGVGLQPR